LAFYRLAEHVRKALPPTVESRAEVRALRVDLERAHNEAEHGLDTVRSMEAAAAPLAAATETLRNAILLQQEIRAQQQKRYNRMK